MFMGGICNLCPLGSLGWELDALSPIAHNVQADLQTKGDSLGSNAPPFTATYYYYVVVRATYM